MTAYLVALLLVTGAVIAGRAICAACGGAPAAAPVVGLAALLVLSALGVRLPGTALTAAVLVALALVGAVVWMVRSKRLARPDPAALLAGALAAAVGSVPFLSAGTVGVPGVSFNNDTSVHLLWAEGLRSAEMAVLYPSNPGYPLGPHALLATLASATGVGMDVALTALVIVLPVLMALVVLGVLRRGVPIALAVPAAACVAFSYLGSAYYGQAAFKEPLLALLLLGFAVSLEPIFRPGHPSRARAAVPAGVLLAAALLTYSYLALAWFGPTGVLFLAFTAVTRGRLGLGQLVAAARAGVAPALVGAGVTLLCVAAELPRLWRYASSIGASPAGGGIEASELGNLAQPIETSAALGIRPIADWRFPPAADTFLLGQWKAVALACVVGGALYLLARRREPMIPAVLGAAALVVALSSGRQAPYVTAKALAILAPFVALVIARALLVRPHRPGDRASALYGARIVLAAALFLAGGVSAAKVLRWGPVESPAQRDQLAALRPMLGDGPTLLLATDDYAGWRLRGMRLAYPGPGFPPPIAFPVRPAKPFTYGQATDWDSVAPAALDGFRYVVTTRTDYDSAPPANFRLLRRTQLYEAWERTGGTPARQTLEPTVAPFAALDCKKASARRLSRRAGTATIRPTAPVRVSDALPPLAPGSATPLAFALPPGTWSLSMQYESKIPLRLQLGPRKVRVPANTTRPGAWWPVLRLRSTGDPQELLVIPERVSRVTPDTIATSVSGVVAVREEAGREVPLRRACGRVVDFYRLAPGER